MRGDSGGEYLDELGVSCEYSWGSLKPFCIDGGGLTESSMGATLSCWLGRWMN